MYGKLSRREFLKATAATMAMLSLSSQLPLPRARAQSRLMTEGPNAFTAVASTLPTGNAIMDISAGWDGAQWALDAQGIPHVYDAVQQSWEAFGRGVDTVTKLNDDLYLFRGAEVAIYNTTTNQVSMQLISEVWPQLPPMFTHDLDGATVVFGSIVLFRSGRYVDVNNPTNPQALNTIANWPTDSWPDGVVQRAGTFVVGPGIGLIFSASAGADLLMLTHDDDGKLAVWSGSATSLQDLPFTTQLGDIATQAFTGYILEQPETSAGDSVTVFQGPTVWTVSQNQPLAAAGNAIAAWFPRIVQTPPRSSRQPVEFDGRRDGRAA